MLVVDTSPRVARVRLLARGTGADRRRRRVPGPPRAHQARAAVDPVRPGAPRTPACSPTRIRERAAAFRDEYRAYVERHGDDRHRARRPRRARRADPARRPGRGRYVDEGRAAVARPLPPRDRGDGRRARARRLRLARRGGELRDRVLAARALQAVARAAARRAAGQGRARHRRGRRHRPRRGRLARVRGRVRRRRSTSTARAPSTRSRRSATAACRVAGDVTSEESVRASLRARRSRRSAASTSSSPTPASPRARRSRRRRWPSGTATTRSSAPATSSSRARRSRCCARQGTRRLDRLRRLQERAGRRARTRPPTRRPRRPSCTSRAASPRRAGRAGIRVNTVNPDAVLQGSRIWDSSWREERAAAYGIEPDELEEHYRKRTTLGVNILPEDIAEAVLHFASDRAVGQEHRQRAQRRRRRARRLSALSVRLRLRARRCGRPRRCGRRPARSAGSRPRVRPRAARRRGS